MAAKNILIISQDQEFSAELLEVLEARGYGAYSAWNMDIARMIIDRYKINFVICGSGALRGNGGDFLEWIAVREPEVVTVVLSDWADWEAVMRGVERALEFDGGPTVGGQTQKRKSRTSASRLPLESKLEKNYPGLSRLRIDPDGFLIL